MNVRAAIRDGKVRLAQFAVGQVDKLAPCISCVAIVQDLKRSACWQRGAVELGYTGARRQPVKTVLAFFVGHGVGAVFKVNPHAGNPGIPCILNTVASAIGEYLSDDVGLVGKHTAHDLHAHRSPIRLRRPTDCHCRIDPAATLATHTCPNAVAQGRLSTRCNAPHRELQVGSAAPCRICSHDPVEPRRTPYIYKAGRQDIIHHGSQERCRADVVQLNRVINEIADFRRPFVGRFLNE